MKTEDVEGGNGEIFLCNISNEQETLWGELL